MTVAEPKVKWVVDVPYNLFEKLEAMRGDLPRWKFLDLMAKDDKLKELARLKEENEKLKKEIERLQALVKN